MRTALLMLGLVLGLSLGSVARAETARAIFASGCFWCTESDFEKLDGVTSVVSGYTGGTLAKPKYEQVGRGNTGHTEAVEIVYDPAKISYAKLLDHFWRTHDLFDGDGQFCDQGSMYRPGIFYLDDAQKQAAEASRANVQKKFDQKIQTEITQAGKFWPAEDYHQDYYKENSLRYRYYRSGCGRDARIKQIWDSAKP
ncbi:MAG: peptide-methionine (S)-S-oxide reductase MsrA [Panacagrimonas sp.]